MPHFMFPATAALMLAEHTYAGATAIANALRNYGRDSQDWWILSSRPDHRHWHMVPARGGWLVSLGGLPSVDLATIEPPF
jgi:hypothetical protein